MELTQIGIHTIENVLLVKPTNISKLRARNAFVALKDLILVPIQSVFLVFSQITGTQIKRHALLALLIIIMIQLLRIVRNAVKDLSLILNFSNVAAQLILLTLITMENV